MDMIIYNYIYIYIYCILSLFIYFWAIVTMITNEICFDLHTYIFWYFTQNLFLYMSWYICILQCIHTLGYLAVCYCKWLLKIVSFLLKSHDFAQLFSTFARRYHSCTNRFTSSMVNLSSPFFWFDGTSVTVHTHWESWSVREIILKWPWILA